MANARVSPTTVAKDVVTGWLDARRTDPTDEEHSTFSGIELIASHVSEPPACRVRLKQPDHTIQVLDDALWHDPFTGSSMLLRLMLL